MNRDRFKLTHSPILQTNGPLIPQTEAERMKASEKHYFMTEEQRQAIIERHGAPTMPYRPQTRTHYLAKGRKG